LFDILKIYKKEKRGIDMGKWVYCNKVNHIWKGDKFNSLLEYKGILESA